MHGYSIDSDERRNLVIILALLGIGLAYLASVGQDLVDRSWPWWFDAPAAFGFTTLLYTAFDRSLWRWRIFHWLSVVATPDFTGDWEGTITSSHDKHATDHPVSVHINQRWTLISIVLEGKDSRSRSQLAGVVTKSGAAPRIVHTYVNEPRSGSVESMNIHFGTATMTLNEGGDILDGDYYTGRGRKTEGRIRLHRSRPVK